MRESTAFGARPPVWRRREAPPPSWMGVWLSAQCTSSLSAQCTSPLSAQCTSSLSAQCTSSLSSQCTRGHLGVTSRSLRGHLGVTFSIFFFVFGHFPDFFRVVPGVFRHHQGASRSVFM